jgi:hypothetical protein
MSEATGVRIVWAAIGVGLVLVLIAVARHVVALTDRLFQ